MTHVHRHRHRLISHLITLTVVLLAVSSSMVVLVECSAALQCIGYQLTGQFYDEYCSAFH